MDIYYRVMYGKCPKCMRWSEFRLVRACNIHKEFIDAWECNSCGKLVNVKDEKSIGNAVLE